MKHLTISIFLILGCHNENEITSRIIGKWQAMGDSSVLIEFNKNGEYILDSEEVWNYRFINDSLFQLYNTPFDNIDYNKPVKIISIDSTQLILYDSLWSKRGAFHRVGSPE